MLALAQGSRYQSYALDQSGHPLGNLSIRVCSVPIIATPCANLAALATDATLGVSAPNPVTTDSVGNFSFYTAPGFYHLQYYSAASLIYEEDIQVSLTTPTGQVNATFVDASVGYKVAGSYGANGTCLVSTGTASVWGACASGGAGTVTSFSAGTLTPLFTTSVTNPTTIPALAFSLSTAAAHTFFGNTSGSTGSPSYSAITLADLPSSGAHTVATTAPLGGGGSVALGGTLTLTCTTCLTAVTAHNLLSATHGDTTAAAAVRGDGIFAVGASPTWQRLAHPATSGGYFKWNGTDIVASSLAASGTGSPTSCTNQAVTAFTLSGDAAPTSTCTTITSAFTSGTFTATAHALLSAIHSDTTIGTVARGDVVTGQGVSPTWTRLARGTANQILAMDGTGTDVVWAPAPAGTGTVTSIATTSPISGGTITTTGTISCPNCVDKTLSNTYSASTTQAMDTITAKYWGGAPVFDVSKFAGVDWCAKVLAVYSDAAFIAASKAVLDARGLTGSQTCAAGSTTLSATKPVHWILGQMTLSLPNSGVSFLDINGVQTSLAAPAAPTLATVTTGGSLAAATTYGVKVAYCNLTGVTVGSSETTQLTGAGATNTITVTSPTAGVGSSVQAYNVYSATPVGSGWKLNNTTGCVPLGTNYVIKTVGAGAIPLATGTAWEGMLEFEGQGDSTVISEDSVNSPFLISNNNVYIHNLKFVSSQTTNNNGSLWIDSSNDVFADHITCAGGGNCIFINASTRITASNIHYGNPTVSGSAVASASSSNVRAINVTMNNSVMPAGGNLQGAVSFNACTDCSVNGVIARSNDMSLITNAAAVIVQGASLRTNINDVNCDALINSDCVGVLGFSLNTNISNVNCSNTAVGTGAGIGTNTNNGDCIDLFSAGRVNIINAKSQSMGLTGGLRFPSFEFFDSSEVSATNIASYDSSGEGVKLFGCTGCSITGSHFNRNGKSGILLVDSATVVTCNNTTTVVYVSGNGFGPWPPGTTVNIGAGPTAFQIASVASTTSMTLTAACNLGASQAFTVFTQDTQLNGNQTDDNGTGLQGANTQSGIDLLGSSQATIGDGSGNDNRATASKTQMFGLNVGSTTAGASLNNFDPSANLGGTCTNEIGPATAGNHWICDLGKKTPILIRNGSTPTWLIAPASANGASLNFPAGVAPTTPVSGDFWNDATAMAYRDPTSGINQYLPKKIYLTGNYTNSTTGLTNVTSGNTLAFAVAASKDYLITCELFYQAASTGGLQIGFTGPASPTAVNYSVELGTTATTINTGAATAFTTKIPTVGVAATATTNFPAHVVLMLRNGANAGTVTLQAASVAAVQLTINNTSACSIW